VAFDMTSGGGADMTGGGADDMSGGGADDMSSGVGGADLASDDDDAHGCGCRIAGREPTQPGAMIFVGLLVAALVLRRRSVPIR